MDISSHIGKVWITVAAISGIAITCAFAVVAIPGEFDTARALFWITAGAIILGTVISLVGVSWPFWQRALSGGVIGALVVILLVEALRLVARREAASFSPPTAATFTAPTFSEKVETVSIQAGGWNMVQSADALRTGVFIPMRLPGSSPFRVYTQDGAPIVDVVLQDGSAAKPPLEIRHNEFIDRTPTGWDRNYNNSAFEVVNENRDPIFQLIYKTPSRIQINGILRHRRGTIVLHEGATYIGPLEPLKPLKPIFRYPSWENAPGIYAEQSDRPSTKPIALAVQIKTATYANIGEQADQETALLIAVSITNNGVPTTVGNYTLDIEQLSGVVSKTRRVPVPDSVSLDVPGSGSLQGGDAALDERTPILPIHQGRPAAGLLLFASKLSLDEVTRVGTKLKLRCVDMDRGEHTAEHSVQPTTEGRP